MSPWTALFYREPLVKSVFHMGFLGPGQPEPHMSAFIHSNDVGRETEAQRKQTLYPRLQCLCSRVPGPQGEAGGIPEGGDFQMLQAGSCVGSQSVGLLRLADWLHSVPRRPHTQQIHGPREASASWEAAWLHYMGGGSRAKAVCPLPPMRGHPRKP